MSVTFSRDGQRLATGGDDGTARLWTLQGQELAKLAGHQGDVWSVTFSPDGQRLATRRDDGTVRLWDLQGQELAKLESLRGSIRSVTFSPDGQRLATSGDDGTMRLWDLQGQQIAQYEGGLGALNHDWSRIAIVQPSNPLVSDSANDIVTIWAVDDLNGLLSRACDHLRWFITYSPLATDSDRALCNLPPRTPAPTGPFESSLGRAVELVGVSWPEQG
jgi:WD40 repeat protein